MPCLQIIVASLFWVDFEQGCQMGMRNESRSKDIRPGQGYRPPKVGVGRIVLKRKATMTDVWFLVWLAVANSGCWRVAA